MASLATPTDADIWHTCSGPLQVGADGQSFVPSPESVVKFSQTIQKCNACTRSGRYQAESRPTRSHRLPRDLKPKSSRENKTRGRSPPSRRHPINDAVLNASESCSDHELGPNPPLSEQQQAILEEMLASDNKSATGYDALDDHEQRALEASLAELYVDRRNPSPERSRSPSLAGEFGPFDGLEDKLDELVSRAAEDFHDYDGHWHPERSRSPSPSGEFGPFDRLEDELDELVFRAAENFRQDDFHENGSVRWA